MRMIGNCNLIKCNNQDSVYHFDKADVPCSHSRSLAGVAGCSSGRVKDGCVHGLSVFLYPAGRRVV
jgi:hypothetical protein